MIFASEVFRLGVRREGGGARPSTVGDLLVKTRSFQGRRNEAHFRIAANSRRSELRHKTEVRDR